MLISSGASSPRVTMFWTWHMDMVGAVGAKDGQIGLSIGKEAGTWLFQPMTRYDTVVS